MDVRIDHPPERPAAAAAGGRLTVAVICTAADATITALRTAASLASRLHAHIVLVALQIVPYPRPLNSSPVRTDFQQRRLCAIAIEARVETDVRVYLCRDRLQALGVVLDPHSLVVIGGRKRAWPTAETRLARQLRRAGHHVILTVTA